MNMSCLFMDKLFGFVFALVFLSRKGAHSLCAPYTLPPAAPAGTEVIQAYSNGRNVGSVITFSCQEPWRLEGSTKAYCSVSNIWKLDQTYQPQCLLKPDGNETVLDNTTETGAGRNIHSLDSCQPISGLANGILSCTDGNKVQSWCTFSCDEGYSLLGPETLECLENGWSLPIPSCAPDICTPIPGIPNGVLSCTDNNKLGSWCGISCNEGYIIQGESRISCDESGWSALVPICRSTTCPPIPGIVDGVLSCTNNNLLDSWCSVSCNKGFLLHGPSVFSCSVQGWSSVIPQCWHTACRALDNPQNGLVSCTDASSLDSRCTYSCFTGFDLQGDVTVVCELGKTWSATPPSCKVAACPALAPLTQGFFSCTGEAYVNSFCTFSCSTGYKLAGAKDITCGSDLNWSQPQPICTNANCPSADQLVLGHEIKCSDGNNVGSECVAECTDESGTTQRAVYVCEITKDNTGRAKWSNTVNDCLDAPVKKGSIYACEDTVVDLMLATTDSVKISDTLLFIRALVLSLKSYIYANMLVGFATASMTECEEGVQTKVDVTFGDKNFLNVISKVNAAYSDPLTCGTFVEILRRMAVHIKQKGRRFAIPFVVIVNHEFPMTATDIAEAEFLISDEFKVLVVTTSDYRSAALDRSNIIMRYNVGVEELVNDIISYDCPGTQCPATALSIPNGQRFCLYVRGSGDHCEFSCDEGYVLRGGPVLGCLAETSTWSAPTPVCRSSKCDPIPISPHRTYECSDSNNHGSTCAFKCEPRTFISGDNTVVCQLSRNAGGEWSKGLPTCESDLLCQPPLEAPTHGTLACPNGNRFNQECVVTCDEGYVIQGSKTLQCSTPRSDGTAGWSAKMPTCNACSSNSCEKDLLIVLAGSGSITKEEFDATMTSLILLIRTLRGAIEEDKVHIGVVQVNGRATLLCDSGFVQKLFRVELDMASHPFNLIVKTLSGMTHLRGCALPAHAIKRAVTYMGAVARPLGSTQRIIVLLTNGKASEAAEEEIANAEEQDISVVVLGTDGSDRKDLDRLIGSKGRVVGIAMFTKENEATEPANLAQKILQGRGARHATVVNLILLGVLASTFFTR